MQPSRNVLILWLLLLGAGHPVAYGSQQCSVATGNYEFGQNACTSTQMHRKQSLLSRKKRYIFWAPGSAVLATFSFAKALASQFPRGVNIVAEADLFYPLPTKITDWYPTNKKPPVAAVKSPKIDTNIADIQYVPFVENSQQDAQQQPYTMRPSNYWNRSPAYSPQPASTTRLRPATAYVDRSSASTYNVAGRRRYGQSATSWRKRPAAAAATDRYYRPRPDAQQFNSYQDWRHHSGFRQRRDLYTQFEKMASDHGLSIRGCLLRMICEARHYLLPRGKSFFHDVLRIMFYVPIRRQSTPTTTTKEDEYAEAMRSTLADCTSAYRQQCRYSILGLLLSREQHTFA